MITKESPATFDKSSMRTTLFLNKLVRNLINPLFQTGGSQVMCRTSPSPVVINDATF